MFESHLLSLITLAPAVAAIGLGLIPGRYERLVRWLAFGISLGIFFTSLLMWMVFDPSMGGMQMVEKADWIPQFGIEFHLGVDGISLLLVLLTTLLVPVVIAASWTSVRDKVKAFHICLLLLTTGMVGAFLALDVFLFYVFWEFILIPMYFIIGVWGGARRIYAAVKFFIFTMAGSVLMLVAILYTARVHFETTGIWSFDYFVWLETASQIPMGGVWSPQMLVFIAFALAFAIKVPMFPFHTWLPDAHVEAPTGGSIILAGVLLKLGTYGFLRFNRALFPEAWEKAVPVIMVLAVIGIVYGAFVALVQPDIKKLVAYSSVSHLGFVMLGLAAGTISSTQGAILQMVNHGLATGALFLLIGILYERRGTLLIADYGGIATVVPVLTGFFLLVTLASIGLPGLNGFVGEFLILAGSWPVAPAAVVGAGLGVVLGAVTMLWMVQRVFWNPLSHEENRGLRDMNFREVATVLPLVLFIVWIGVFPMTFLAPMEAAVRLLLE
ncbi:MAG: NADH-quinone oxidoreductase subunit M [Thermoanaerobaculales bacterium]|nr:NADH-quinone oxidoreductase subunit M [Thermoanaerobaculales bacterium]